MNAAQLSRSRLLAALRTFYAEATRLRDEIQVKGEDLPAAQIQSRLVTLMQDLQRTFGADEFNNRLFEDIRFVMVALADDMFLHLEVDWIGHDDWLEASLERQIFKTQRAGVAFFENIDELLESRDTSQEEVAVAYLLAILLGFKGRYRGQEGKVEGYRAALANFVSLGQGTTLMDTHRPLFPDAVAHTIVKEPATELPDHRRYIKWLAVLFIVYLGAAHTLWYMQTQDIRDHTRASGAAAAEE